MRNLLLFALLVRMVPLAAALFQFIGTALIVWGLRFTSDTGVVYHPPGGRAEIPHAGIVAEHRWAFGTGVVLLLGGLALQVVAALLSG